MERSERLATSVTPETKQQFRIRAAEKGMNMSEYLRHLVLEDIDAESDEGNPKPAAVATAD